VKIMAKRKTTATWPLAAANSDRIAKLLTEIPGWDGYEYADETQEELRIVAALLQQAIPLLEQAGQREAQR